MLRLDKFLPYRLSIASNAVSEIIAGAYAEHGLVIPEWRLIAVLAQRSRATQQELGQATRMDKVTVSRAALSLSTRGLILRAPNKADRRSHFLSLSAAGRALYKQVAPKALALEQSLLASFKSAEIERLEAMLHRLEAAAGAHAEEAAGL